jgi:hypothetical protein
MSIPFGPWVVGVDELERRAGLRALAALVAVYCGSDNPVVSALRCAESDIAASDQALAAFDRLPSLWRRRVIAAYAAVMYPRRRPGGAR